MNNNRGFLAQAWHLFVSLVAKPYQDAGIMIRRVWIGSLKITSDLTLPEMMKSLMVIFRVHILWLAMYLPIIIMPVAGIMMYSVFFTMSIFTMPITAFALILLAVRRYNNIGVPLIVSLVFVIFAMTVEFRWIESFFQFPRYVYDFLDVTYFILVLGAFLPGNLLRKNKKY